MMIYTQQDFLQFTRNNEQNPIYVLLHFLDAINRDTDRTAVNRYRCIYVEDRKPVNDGQNQIILMIPELPKLT